MNTFTLCLFLLTSSLINFPVDNSFIGNQRLKDERVKFDSFSNNSAKPSWKKHLETFAFEVNIRSKETGYIISYAGTQDKTGESLGNLLKIKNFLIKGKNISSERVVFLDGGCRKEGTTDIYFVPIDACPPKPNPTAKCLDDNF